MGSTPFDELVCGLVGGALGVGCTHPIDTVKTHLQAGSHKSLRQLVCSQGISGLYRGLAVPIVSQPLSVGACFSGFALGRQIYDHHLAPYLGLTFIRFILAAIVGGIASGLAVTPGERLKVWVQSQTVTRDSSIDTELLPLHVSEPTVSGKGAKGSAAARSKGSLALVLDLLRKGGIGTLFTGLQVTILREIPGTLIWFGSFEGVSAALEAQGVSRSLAVLGGSVAAGMTFWLAALPVDRIKTMQQSGAKATAWQLARHIWRTEGLRGFYVGVGPTLVRGLLLDMIQFSTADGLRRRLALLRHASHAL